MISVADAVTTVGGANEQGHTAPRLALLIANADYRTAPVPYAADNAHLIAESLTRSGFEVTVIVNQGDAETAEALDAFSEQVANAKAEIALLYFVGKAVQLRDENWLLPRHLDLKREHDVRYGAISLNQIAEVLGYAGARLNLVILDVVTGQALTEDIKPSRVGLATPQRGSLAANTVVAFPGGAGRTLGMNPVFGQAWAHYMEQPGLPIEQLFNKVRAQVSTATEQKQTPREFGYMTVDFSFNEHGTAGPALLAGASPPATRSLTLPTAADQNEQSKVADAPATASPPDPMETAYWDTVKDSDDTELLQSYLLQYPQGAYAASAKQRIGALTAPAPDLQTELVFWQTVADTQDPDLYQAYLDTYPNGRFAVLARRLRQKRSTVPGADQATVTVPNPLVATAAPAPTTRSIPQVSTPDVVTTPVVDPKVAELIANGRRAFNANNLTTPRDNNAASWAKQVLAIDADNQDARTLLREIVGRYQGWASSQLRRGALDKAEGNLRKAKRLRRYSSATQGRKQNKLESTLASQRQIALAPPPVPIAPPPPKEEKGFWQGVRSDFKNLGCSLGGIVGRDCGVGE